MPVVIDKQLLRHVTLENLSYRSFYSRDDRLPFIHFKKGFDNFQNYISTHSLNELEDTLNDVVDKSFLTGNQEHNDIFTMFKMLKLTKSFLEVGMKQPMCASGWNIAGRRILVEEQGNTRLMCCRILEHDIKFPVVVTNEHTVDEVTEQEIKKFVDNNYSPDGSQLMPTPIMTSLSYIPLLWKQIDVVDWWQEWNALPKSYVEETQKKLKDRQVYMYNSYNKYSITRNINYKGAAELLKTIDPSEYNDKDFFKKCLETVSACI